MYYIDCIAEFGIDRSFCTLCMIFSHLMENITTKHNNAKKKAIKAANINLY